MRPRELRIFFDANGNLISIHQLDAEQESCVAALEVLVKNAKAVDGHTDEVYKFKLWDKLRALEGLAKHFGLVKERLDSSRSVSK